jgi:hypothetical protein
VDGIDDGVAIIPYYAPGLIADALKSTDKAETTVIPVLSAFFPIFSKGFRRI